MIDPSLITSVDPPPGGERLNIQISPCGTKIWVCIDGANVFRYRNLKGITIDDQRAPVALDDQNVQDQRI